MNGELMISPNMLTIGTTREAMVLYKALFRAILTKRLVSDLDGDGMSTTLTDRAPGGSGRGGEKKGFCLPNY